MSLLPSKVCQNATIDTTLCRPFWPHFTSCLYCSSIFLPRDSFLFAIIIQLNHSLPFLSAIFMAVSFHFSLFPIRQALFYKRWHSDHKKGCMQNNTPFQLLVKTPVMYCLLYTSTCSFELSERCHLFARYCLL